MCSFTACSGVSSIQYCTVHLCNLDFNQMPLLVQDSLIAVFGLRTAKLGGFPPKKNEAVGAAQSVLLERLNTTDIMESLDGDIGKLHDAQ